MEALLAVCSFPACSKTVPQLIKGCCPACYQRQWKKGSVFYEALAEKATCEVEGCDLPVKAKGLCQKHYMRVRRHDTAADTRPNGWGAKSKHPLWESWKSMLRQSRGDVDPRWKDFWTFLDEVGERPAGQRLFRIDAALPYRKGNMEWRAPILEGARRRDHAAYQRAQRVKRGSVNRDRYLRGRYGITLAEFDALLAAQGGGCAICGRKEGHEHPITGEKVSLAMDHSAVTGTNRAILCHPHNRALGLFDHDPVLLRRAADYRDHHAAKATPES